ncbi:hypothetical protein GCM10010206_57860 [Streptomyces cinerochromogenes]|nr:hypothetical protein GCM10010206_57860 [Streptomyces cinerochromogenes]
MERAAAQGRVQFRGGDVRVLCGMPHAEGPFCEVSLRLVRPPVRVCGATPVGAGGRPSPGMGRPDARVHGPEFPRIEAC